ncbi:helix-turn-helix transcriptional regulator [Clostridioides difficile]
MEKQNLEDDERRQRLKDIRLSKKIKQKDFGKKLGLSLSQISSYETGHRKIPQRTINDICREFNVNEQWLLHGEGEMFVDITEDLETSEEIKTMIKKIFALEDEDREAIEKIIDNAYLKIKNEEL